MKSKMVILANSWRPGGRCIAGIDLNSGTWIRPVSRNIERAIPSKVAVNILDIVEVSIADKPMPNDRYQAENIFVDDWNWKITSSLRAGDVMKYCENNSPILHSRTDSIDSKYLDILPPHQWKSLQMIKTTVAFNPDKFKSDEWRATIKDSAGYTTYLKVKDVAICEKLKRGEKTALTCLLTISLTRPWAPEDDKSKPEKCYKLVAGVIELPE